MTFDSPILAPNGKPAYLEVLRNSPEAMKVINQWYEGSRFSPLRSYIFEPVQSAKDDLDRFTREELSKNARYLYKNSPFIRGLIERLVTLTVGSGFHPVFKSSNKKWNAKAQAWYAKKARNIHLGPRASMQQYQRAVGRARFVDGEAYSIKTFDEESYTDRIQGLESNYCCGTDGKTIVDGKKLNKQGTVVAYKFRGVEAPYESDSVVHHFTPNRIGQYNGETILAAAINTARDVDDILALEKNAVKDASSRQDIIKTASGELSPEMYRSMRFGTNAASQTLFSLPADNTTRDDYYRLKFQAAPVVLRNGDEYTPYEPKRPGAAWQGFMDFLSGTICLSTSLPPTVVLPIAAGGTDVRRDLDIAQRVVEPWQQDMVLELDDILSYFLDGEVADGELRDAPADYMLRSWHMPQQINVDRSQQAQDRELVSAGLLSREEYHGRYSEDGDAYDLTVIEEVKVRRDRIKAAGFKDIAEFVQLLSLDPKLFMSKPEGTPAAPK